MSDQASLPVHTKVLRAGTYFFVVLLVSTGVAVAVVDSIDSPVARSGYVAVAGLLGALLILLVHQPVRRLSLLSVALLALAFIVPWKFVHDTVIPCRESGLGPCDPAFDYQLGLRAVLFTAFLVGALVASVMGFMSSRRQGDTSTDSARDHPVRS